MLVVDVGVNLVKSWQRAQIASLVSLRAEDDPQRHGRRREETRGGLGLRRGVDGYLGPVLHGRVVAEPHNLGRGWVGFDFAEAFGCPVKVVNDAAMQALGSYRGGNMLFLGLGTGLGSTMIVDGIIAPMELGHLPYKKSTYEDYVGRAGLERHGKTKWRRYVADVVTRLIAALGPDETVIGGGNAGKLAALPPRTRAGHNANALRGGFLLWQEKKSHTATRSMRRP